MYRKGSEVRTYMGKISKKEWEKILKMGYPDVDGDEGIATEGLYRGGEHFVSRKLGKNNYIPINVEEIIEAGLVNLKKQILPLEGPEEIANKIRSALRKGNGFSVISLGDGELIVLAHDILLSTAEIKKNQRLVLQERKITSQKDEFPLLNTGINLPNHHIRDTLAKNVLEAHAVGIPTSRYPTYQCMFNNLVKHYQWPLNKMSLTNSVIGYRLNHTTIYHELLSNYKVLLIGNKMNEGKAYFNKLGYNSIVGTIPVPGFNSYEGVIKEANKYDFDIALVAAGVAANVICVELSKKKKIAIDIGRLIDEYIQGIKTIRKN